MASIFRQPARYVFVLRGFERERERQSRCGQFGGRKCFDHLTVSSNLNFVTSRWLSRSQVVLTFRKMLGFHIKYVKIFKGFSDVFSFFMEECIVQML